MVNSKVACAGMCVCLALAVVGVYMAFFSGSAAVDKGHHIPSHVEIAEAQAAPTWTPTRVQVWLEEVVELPRYSVLFREKAVDGEMLLGATAMWLRDGLGIDQEEDIEKLMTGIHRLHRASECPNWLRRLVLSPILEGWSCMWRSVKSFFTLHWIASFQFFVDASLWGTAVYPGLELLSIFGAVSPPTCGFARIGPCEEYPCWLLFDDDSSRFQWFLDGIAVPLVLIGIFFRCCMPCFNAIVNKNQPTNPQPAFNALN